MYEKKKNELQSAKWFTDYTTALKEIEVTYVYIKNPESVELPTEEPTEPATKAPKATVIQKNSAPKTGDTTNIWIWCAIAVCALSAAGTAVVINRKKSKENK